jgi:hypothetical protein
VAVRRQWAEGEARRQANNGCAYLASGVTDAVACARTLPTRRECTEVE